MLLRSMMLNILSDSQFHSGEELGEMLGVSRMAIWKHIRALRECGLELEVVRGKGYRLPEAVELIDGPKILDAVSDESRRALVAVETFLEIDSTNDYLREKAFAGASSGLVCIAERQLAGRGRHNRQWVSPFAANLYLSLLWRSATGTAELGGLSLAIGVAVLRGLRSMGIISAGLKWPNDILVDGAKLAGILIDVVGESTGPCSVIIGIGINVAMPENAAVDIDQDWTDLCTLTGRTSFPRNQLAVRIIDSTMAAIQDFEQAGLGPFLEEWRKYDVINGRLIRLQLPNEVIQGRVCGIDSGGALLVDTGHGHRRFSSGEVSLRGAS